MPKPCVLVANDDGIDAPGIQALIAALVEAAVADVHVCAPSGERSAQSHAVTIGRPLAVDEQKIAGVCTAHAVDGTPADCMLLALYSPLFENPDFDLVLSGINRGENMGLHVIYSGTVGAAREATIKDVPAIALSLDNPKARSVEDYRTAALVTVALAQAMLGLLPGQDANNPPAVFLRQNLLNITFPGPASTERAATPDFSAPVANLPPSTADPSSSPAHPMSSAAAALVDASARAAQLPTAGLPFNTVVHTGVLNNSQHTAAVRDSQHHIGINGSPHTTMALTDNGAMMGLYLTRQSRFYQALGYTQVAEHDAEQAVDCCSTARRVFKSFDAATRCTAVEGYDDWAIKNGWVSITPLALTSDVAGQRACDSTDAAVLAAVSAVVAAASAYLGVSCGGIVTAQP